MSRHGKLAWEYWETYRPQALAELSDPQSHFAALDLRVSEQIGALTDEMLAKLPINKRGQARQEIRAQAREIVYAEEIWLEKEPGTEHREM